MRWRPSRCLLLLISCISCTLPAANDDYAVTVVTGLYSVRWSAVLANLTAITAQPAPLSLTLQRAFASGYLKQHGLARFGSSSSIALDNSVIAAILPSSHTLLPLHKAAYEWPCTNALQQLLSQHGQQMLAVHVFDPSSTAELLQNSNVRALRHLHAFFSVQLVLLLESPNRQCYSLTEGGIRQDTTAISTMIEQLGALSQTLHELSQIGIRSLLLAMQAACKQSLPTVTHRPDARWDAIRPVLMQASMQGVGARIAQLVRSATAIIEQTPAAGTKQASTSRPTVVFFAGLEGTGHHLWAHMLTKCASAVCNYNFNLGKALRDLMLHYPSRTIAATHANSSSWLRELFASQSGRLTLINAARSRTGSAEQLLFLPQPWLTAAVVCSCGPIFLSKLY